MLRRPLTSPAWWGPALFVAGGCGGGAGDAGPARVRPQAVVEAGGGWLTRPFPSEDVDGGSGPGAAGQPLDWSVLPEAPTPLGTTLVGGWAGQASQAAAGASHQQAVYFPFAAALDGELQAGDVGLRDAAGADVPVRWIWIDDAAGDPFLRDDTLIVMPAETSPLNSGERYVAWVSDRVATAAAGWTPPQGTPDGAAVATAFTVQDTLGQGRGLAAATVKALAAQPEVLQPTAWRRALSLRYEQGVTPSGKEATLATVTFEQGAPEVTYLAPNPGDPSHALDLDGYWPFEVWEARISTFAFQPTARRPWASPGVGLLGDFGRRGEGWIRFEGGAPVGAPTVEELRVVVQAPRRGDGPFSVLMWDHGTGGHAYNAVARDSPDDQAAEVAAAAASGGAIIVSRDQPLYGQRYPLIDEGFGASLGFYNIGNLPAFRDNQRQAWVDHWVTRAFATQVLPGRLGVDVATDRLGALGHSLGSVTLHGALVAQPDPQALAPVKAAFMSGSGGYLTYYILQSGLLGTGHSLITNLAPLLGLSEELLASASPAELIAAIIGLPETAWPNMGPHHPVMQLFGVIMDPSDPLMYARSQTVPETLLLGVGDLQVPNDTTRWLGEVHPAAEVIECQPRGEYDPHVCLFREPEGAAALRAFVQAL